MLVGGRTPEGPGGFSPPTVLTDVDSGSRPMDTEIFGPVAAILTFDDEDEVVSRANGTPWGLVGYLFTEGLDRALRVSERLEVGMVGLNTGLVSNPESAVPWGQAVGGGPEGGRVGIEEFPECQYLAIPVR